MFCCIRVGANTVSNMILNWGIEVGLVLASTGVKGVSGLELGVFGDIWMTIISGVGS